MPWLGTPTLRSKLIPNHETNNVVILGAPENIRRFVTEAFVQPGQPFPRDPESLNDKDFPVIAFDLISPPPENIEKGGCNGQHAEGEVCWYTWNLENWGTKWGAYSHTYYNLSFFKEWAPEDEDVPIQGRVDLRFDTAWSQPTPIFDRIKERWDLEVHAVTQDEGGFPDVVYGDPIEAEVMRKVVSFEFEDYGRSAADPTLNPDSVGAGYPEEAVSE